MKNLILLTLIVIFTIGLVFFFRPQSRIAHKADYEQYLNPEHLQKSQHELAAQIDFWEQKLIAAPGNLVYQQKLAGLYSAEFRLSGNVHQLHQSDSLLQEINCRFPRKAGVLQSLAANGITRHAFRESESYIRQARQLGEKQFISTLMLVDISLERGNRLEASLLLDDIASTAHFDYLIREAKLQDQSDVLEQAVQSMEKAASLAKASGATSTIYWSLSNLADMYGHEGRVQKSYNTYLEALRYDPAGLHALKGIAWITFSHDNNPEEAKRILAFLQSVHPVPDYKLMLAEIAAYEGDTTTEQQLKGQFIQEASQPAYGNMYKRYICLLESDNNQAEKALEIAKAEIKERPHPLSYQLLAWAAFREGKQAKALNILKKHVIGQTGEPLALYHSGLILKENGKKKEAKKLLEAALDASFELGPVVTADIKRQLEQL